MGLSVCFNSVKRLLRCPRNAAPAPPPASPSPVFARRSIDTPCRVSRGSGESQGTAELPTQPSVPTSPDELSPTPASLSAVTVAECDRRVAGSIPGTPEASRRPSLEEAPEGTWGCAQCTFSDAAARDQCEMCDQPRTESAAPPIPAGAAPPLPTVASPSIPEHVRGAWAEPEDAAAAKIDQSIGEARHKLRCCSIRADDLEVDLETIADELKASRKRLEMLERRDEAYLAE